MQKRTEQDMAAMSPVIVKWGKSEYPIEVLPRQKAREWRDKFKSALGQVAKNTVIEPEGDLAKFSEQLVPALMMNISTSPELIDELVFSYAGNLPQDDPDATDEQAIIAFRVIFALANPFFSTLGMMMDMGSTTLSNSKAPKYTN